MDNVTIDIGSTHYQVRHTKQVIYKEKHNTRSLELLNKKTQTKNSHFKELNLSYTQVTQHISEDIEIHLVYTIRPNVYLIDCFKGVLFLSDNFVVDFYKKVYLVSFKTSCSGAELPENIVGEMRRFGREKDKVEGADKETDNKTVEIDNKIHDKEIDINIEDKEIDKNKIEDKEIDNKIHDKEIDINIEGKKIDNKTEYKEILDNKEDLNLKAEILVVDELRKELDMKKEGGDEKKEIKNNIQIKKFEENKKFVKRQIKPKPETFFNEKELYAKKMKMEEEEMKIEKRKELEKIKETKKIKTEEGIAYQFQSEANAPECKIININPTSPALRQSNTTQSSPYYNQYANLNVYPRADLYQKSPGLSPFYNSAPVNTYNRSKFISNAYNSPRMNQNANFVSNTYNPNFGMVNMNSGLHSNNLNAMNNFQPINLHQANTLHSMNPNHQSNINMQPSNKYPISTQSVGKINKSSNIRPIGNINIMQFSPPQSMGNKNGPTNTKGYKNSGTNTGFNNQGYHMGNFNVNSYGSNNYNISNMKANTFNSNIPAFNSGATPKMNVMPPVSNMKNVPYSNSVNNFAPINNNISTFMPIKNMSMPPVNNMSMSQSNNMNMSSVNSTSMPSNDNINMSSVNSMNMQPVNSMNMLPVNSMNIQSVNSMNSQSVNNMNMQPVNNINNYVPNNTNTFVPINNMNNPPINNLNSYMPVNNVYSVNKPVYKANRQSNYSYPGINNQQTIQYNKNEGYFNMGDTVNKNTKSFNPYKETTENTSSPYFNQSYPTKKSTPEILEEAEVIAKPVEIEKSLFNFRIKEEYNLANTEIFKNEKRMAKKEEKEEENGDIEDQMSLMPDIF